MKKKALWLVVTAWMVAALLLASCAPAVVKEEAEKVAPPVKEKEEVVVPKEVVAPAIEEPRYGGTLILVLNTAPANFTVFPSRLTTGWLMYEGLFTGDWAKGPAGTGEFSFIDAPYLPQYSIGALAEAWELPDPDTVIIHLKKGIHYGLNPKSEASRLVGGREIVADDVAFYIKYMFETRGNWGYTNYPGWFESATATDKYTVVLKGHDKVTATSGALEVIGQWWHSGTPREVWQKYGGDTDWRNDVGTGPFMLTDYVGASSVAYIRNPNYWMTDPVGPGKGNQLPYLDGVKFLIIEDIATRSAALRTGKVDWLEGIGWEEAASFKTTNPELGSVRYLTNWGTLDFRYVGMTGVGPFADIRVRRALHMAIDFESIVKDYYGGNAEMLWQFVLPTDYFKDVYTPVAELPPASRELFEYKPEKAKQLLAEAGYPQGFKTSMTITAPNMDVMNIVQAYWSAIGVDLKLEIKDAAVFSSLYRARTYTTEMIRGSATPSPDVAFKVFETIYGASQNYGEWNDPSAKEWWNKLWSFENIYNTKLRKELLKEHTFYYLDNVIYIQMPAYYTLRMWQPWLKNYHGEKGIGYQHIYNWSRHVWLDQELKKAMGH